MTLVEGLLAATALGLLLAALLFLVPPRPSSTSQEVERLSQGADIIVHSTIHLCSDRTGAAVSFRTPTIVRARPPTLAPWHSAMAQETSCLRT